MNSCIVRAMRKLAAAEYHCTNIAAQVEQLRELAEQEAERSGLTSGNMSAFGEKQNIVYELDAFLAAARSCVDFIAGMLAMHLGMDRKTGITKLLKRTERKPTAAFSRMLLQWKDWIELVKEYRDECVHYRAIEATGGHEIDISDGKKVLNIIPVLVPERILPDKPTFGMPGAGRYLAHLRQSVGIAGIPPVGSEGPVAEAATKFLEMMEPVQEGDGYIRVERFCQLHLDKLHQFVSDAFDEVLPLKFQTYADAGSRASRLPASTPTTSS
jgi:hypothetical protein